MKKLTSLLAAVLLSSSLSVHAYAETETENTVDFGYCDPENGIYTINVQENKALLHDLDNSLTIEEESELINEIINAVQYKNFSIAVVITDDIGSDKSDYGVMDFADVYYEDYCGMDTDGILLLLNNDTKYDWISTSGICIDIFEHYIDHIFDDIWDFVYNGEYANAVSGFCTSVVYYSDSPVYEYDDDDYYNDNYYNDDYYYNDDFDSYDIGGIIEGVFALLIFAGFFIAVGMIIFVAIINSSYKLKKNQGVADYLLKDSMVLTQQTDTYLRTYTTRTRVSSSGSGGSSHRSGGSRSHRSSGGGRHGGGGRRR